MYRVLIAAFIALALLVVFAPIVSAAPTSLNLIPTADLAESHTLNFEQEDRVYTNLYSDEESTLFSIQSGLNSRLETGFDVLCYSNQSDVILNAKYQLLKETEKRPALALGVMDICEGSVPAYYVATAKDAGTCRFHLGAIGDLHKFQLMGGVEVPVNDSISLTADYIAGRDWSAAVGASWTGKTGSSISLVHEFASPSAEANLVFLSLAWNVD